MQDQVTMNRLYNSTKTSGSRFRLCGHILGDGLEGILWQGEAAAGLSPVMAHAT